VRQTDCAGGSRHVIEQGLQPRSLRSQAKAATMSEVRHQLLITLVHGTWGRGFFPRRQRQNRRPLWFEDESPFLARLSTEFGGIPHKITPLLWSGANSIFVRDKTAHVLAEHLSAEHAEHPQATQLVIAHSHGGNIALRAFHHFKQRDASPSCADSQNPLVVTLATPFVEVHPADFGTRPYYVRLAVVLAIICLHIWSTVLLTPHFHQTSLLSVVAVWIWIFGGLVLLIWWGWWWLTRRAIARRNRVQALNDATRLGDAASTQQLLVIRAIDDEASLILAFGTIMNYVTTRSIVTIFALFVAFMAAAGRAGYDTTMVTLTSGWLVLTILLFGIFMVSRSVHGRELAASPMECQINTQSTPDAKGLSEIVTLVRRTYVESLRHGIYDHEDCAKTISNWVRSELCTLPSIAQLIERKP
jgi:hypothetical protein